MCPDTNPEARGERPRPLRSRWDLTACAVALVDETPGGEVVDRRLVASEPLALADDGTVPVDADGGEIVELGLSSRTFAWRSRSSMRTTNRRRAIVPTARRSLRFAGCRGGGHPSEREQIDRPRRQCDGSTRRSLHHLVQSWHAVSSLRDRGLGASEVLPRMRSRPVGGRSGRPSRRRDRTRRCRRTCRGDRPPRRHRTGRGDRTRRRRRTDRGDRTRRAAEPAEVTEPMGALRSPPTTEEALPPPVDRGDPRRLRRPRRPRRLPDPA